MDFDRRQMMRGCAATAGGLLIAGSAFAKPLAAIADPKITVHHRPLVTPAAVTPGLPGVDEKLLERAKAMLDHHGRTIKDRRVIGLVDFNKGSGEDCFHVIDLMAGKVDSFRTTHGRGSDPRHSGYLENFSNRSGSNCTSAGTYTAAELYHGKYGLSMRLDGHDARNDQARARAIVIHNAWYAEPEMLAQHGKLGRSEGCFAFSAADQKKVMDRLKGGRMIFADKIA